MSDHDDHRISLGSYAAGALRPEARVAVDEHLRTCRACRDELTTLSPLTALLARVEPDELDSPPPGADDLLPGLLERARHERRRTRRRLWRWRAAAAVAALATAALATVTVTPAGPPRSAGTSYPLRASPTAPRAAGRVTLARKPWGTQLTLTLRRLPPLTHCAVIVTGPLGRSETVGTWGTTPDHDARVVAATDLRAAELVSVTVETTSGRPLLSASILPARRSG